MTEQDIKNFVSTLHLRVADLPDARFMDQKCIPDVVSAVAECVLVYVGEQTDMEFSKNDIWHSPYANELITTSFSKPDLDEKGAQREYDKFFGQPLRLMSYAGVLSVSKRQNTNYYRIQNREVLEYISMRERNALVFLNAYLEKLFADNGLKPYFDDFFRAQDEQTLSVLRDKLDHLYWDNTNVQKEFEPRRIYNKIINIFAFTQRKKGVSSGRVSEFPITLSDLRYNSVNWRDVNKDKSMTRQEYLSQATQQMDDTTSYLHYSVEKAKRFVRSIENDCSEIHRFSPTYTPTQAHHIFMASQFPELADCPENIICLTPNQHLSKAHPDNKTSIVDLDYQLVCLLCKLDSIEMNNRSGKDDYSLTEFINVLNTGMNTDIFTPQMSYEEVKYAIIKNAYYHH